MIGSELIARFDVEMAPLGDRNEWAFGLLERRKPELEDVSRVPASGVARAIEGRRR
jgi:hypothetical protein